MAEEGRHPVRLITRPIQMFKGHRDVVSAVIVFPDRQRMVTGSYDGMVQLWNLRDGIMLKDMKGHCTWVYSLEMSRDGELIASGDVEGGLIAWDGDTGESITKLIPAHTSRLATLDFSADGMVLASGSLDDNLVKLWSTKTWEQQGDSIDVSPGIYCVRYSPSGELLAIATGSDIQIWRPAGTRECVAIIDVGYSDFESVAWTLDSTRLFSFQLAADASLRTICEWDTSTWMQVGQPWDGHTKDIKAIALNPDATLVASASLDEYVRLWRVSDRQTIAIFRHTHSVLCVAFSRDGKQILSGGVDKNISVWAVPQDALPHSKILNIGFAVRNACIDGDLSTAEDLITQEIAADPSNYNFYANRSFVMARKPNWDQALDDAIKSVSIQPSSTGYISKGIALCGKIQFHDAMKAFDLALLFIHGDSKTVHCILLIKAIALFNAHLYDDAMLRLQELTAACPNTDSLACRVVEAYLRVQLGTKALDEARHNEAADYFTAAVNASTFSSKSAIYLIDSIHEVFVVLFGWDLRSLWQTANQKRCEAFLWAGRLEKAIESYRYMMDMSDKITKVRCLDWSTAFKERCRMVCATNGDVALDASDYDRAIDLYSSAIDLDSATDTVFAKRSKAKLGKMLWEEALIDAKKVIELNPSSYVGYQLKHEALHGAQTDAFKIMLSKLDKAPDEQIPTGCLSMPGISAKRKR